MLRGDKKPEKDGFMRDFACSRDQPASGMGRAVQPEPVRVSLAAMPRQAGPIQFMIAEKTNAACSTLFSAAPSGVPVFCNGRFNWSHADV